MTSPTELEALIERISDTIYERRLAATDDIAKQIVRDIHAAGYAIVPTTLRALSERQQEREG